MSLTVVIAGASGDLTARKLVPALFSLFLKGRLPERCRVVGVARSDLSAAAFRDRLEPMTREALGRRWHATRWDEFAADLGYVAADVTTLAGIETLNSALVRLEESSDADRLYYLSVAPETVPAIVARLGESGTADEARGFRRLVIEKPFGRNLDSARTINRTLHQYFEEDQLFRIDHYLGKETVQNLMVFRCANTLFEPLWNHQYVDHVQITAAEEVLVGRRGAFYETSGVLRDMFQGHLFQVLCMVAMEPPARYTAGRLRDEKVKLLDAVEVPSFSEACGNVVVGQYAGYRQEPGIAADSIVPTFAALKLRIENRRWHGVPFYLRSGKGLARRFSEVVIQFHCPPHLMFPLPPGQTLQCNRLSIRLQPDEGIRLNFQTKVPDQDGVALRSADLHFTFRETFGEGAIPEAYETLILDAIKGDAALFMRSDEIERAWAVIDPLIAATERADAPPQEYAVGTWGPDCSDELLARDGRRWQNP